MSVEIITKRFTRVRLETRACHFNDPEFADAIVEATREMVREREPA